MLPLKKMKLCHLQSGLKILLFFGLTSLLWAESVEWVFEGRIWQMDPELEAAYGSDAIFSGSLQTSIFEPYATGDLAGGESFEGGILGAELTLDRNHLVLLEGIQAEGWPIVDLRPGIETDALVFIVPLQTLVAADEWQVVWLELGLHGSGGQLLPAGTAWPDWTAEFDWDWAWFRLSFSAPDVEERRVIEGGLDVFAAVEEALTPELELERMRLLLADLALDLDERDLQILDLRNQLATADERIAGLNRTLDRVWEDQDRLRAERDRLLEVMPLGDDEAWQQRLAEKEAELALLDESYRSLQEDFEQLRYAYQDADGERRRLRYETESLRDALEQERSIRRMAQDRQGLGGLSDQRGLSETENQENPSFRIVEHPLVIQPVDGSATSDSVQVEERSGLPTVEDESSAYEESHGFRRALQRRRGPRSR